MRFPVMLKNNTVGYITVLENEIYSRCEYTSNDILRLFAQTNENIINLGVLEPSEDNKYMCLKRKFKTSVLNDNTIYYLDDGSGKYKKNDYTNYKTEFNAGKEHKYPYLLTACSLEQVNNIWFSYIKKAQND